jgi:hypothetical protein
MDTTSRRSALAMPSGGARRVWSALAIVVAVILQLIVLMPFTLASGLLAPLWAVVAFHVLWFGCAGVLLVLATRRPLLTPLVPIANALLLGALLTAGDLLLGWTA